MSDLHTAIAAFVQARPPVPLGESAVGSPPDAHMDKAGVVPFLPDGRVYVMCPRGDRPELGAPQFQLCKGTRMIRQGGIWRDLRKKEAAGAGSEALAATALREGEEELGLRLDNIREWFDLGTQAFASASTGKPKWLRLFAAHMRDADAFSAPAPTTAECRWLDQQECEQLVRPDHYALVKLAAERLARR